MEHVYILGISGSPRHGNTEILVKEALEAAQGLTGVSTEYVSLADYELKPCESCGLCFGFVKGATEEVICYQHQDADPIIKKMLKAHGIVMGSPVYTWDVSARLKCLMEKCAPLCPGPATSISYRFRHKVVGAIAVAAGLIEGQESVAHTIWRWAMALGMIPAAAVATLDDPFPGSSLLGGLASTSHSHNLLSPSAVSAEVTRTNPPLLGIQNMKSARNLGRNVAHLARVITNGL
ncbi:MAG: flavodoxin family protein, partial [bacterium]|nr:flavodoxin family protein [bacterium]